MPIRRPLPEPEPVKMQSLPAVEPLSEINLIEIGIERIWREVKALKGEINASEE